MAKKFYHAENSNRTIKSNGRNFHFQPYAHFGGTWKGVFATEKPDEQAALDKLVAVPANAVTEISQSEYEDAVKKKEPVTQGYNPPLSIQSQSAGAKLVDRPAVLVEAPGPENLPKPVPTTAPVETASDALSVGSVPTPAEVAAAEAPPATAESQTTAQ